MSFDVDAWLDAAAPPTRAVRIYGRGDLVARAQALRLTHEQQAEPAGVEDFRLAGPAPAAEDTDAELAVLVEQIEASARTVIVRGLLDTEQRDLLDAARPGGDGTPVDESLYELLLLERAAVEPTFTRAQAEKLRAGIGQAQWDQLFQGISAAGQEPVDVPLSRLGSESGPVS